MNTRFWRNPSVVLSLMGLLMVTAGVGCNGGDGGSVIGTSDTGTGSIAFNVNWDDDVSDNRGVVQSLGASGRLGDDGPSKRATVDRAAAEQVASALDLPGDLPMALAGPIDCDEAGVAEVQAEVYDDLGRLLAVGGPWGCAAHSGTIEDVPAGSDRKVVVKGMSAEGKIYYQGEVEDVAVERGTTTNLGMIEAYANFYIDYVYLQYRTYSDSSRNQYRGDVEIQKAGKVIVPDDIQNLQLKDAEGNAIPIKAPSYYKYNYFEGSFEPETGSITLSNPHTVSDFTIYFPSGTELPAGNYTYESISNSGQLIQQTLYFPGKQVMQPISESSINYEWLTDGGLRLSWQNPSEDHNTISMWLTDENWNDLMYARIPPDVEEVIIPSDEIDKITDLNHPISVYWGIRLGIRDEEGMEYARAYANNVEIGWNDVGVDLLDYWPLTQGSTWLTTAGGEEFYKLVIEGTESINGLDAIKKVFYDSEYENMTVPDDYELWTYDDEFLFIHGTVQVGDPPWNDDPIGLSTFDPPRQLRRLLKTGELFTSESILTTPDGSQYDDSFTWEILGFEDVYVPAGGFSNCLKVKQTESSAFPGFEEYAEEIVWIAKGVGIVQTEEFFPDEGDWQGLISADIVDYASNITFPWMPQFQFRQYSDPTQNRYGAWLDLRKNGTSILEEDVTNIWLRTSDYTSIPIERIEYSNSVSYSAYWDYGEGRFVFNYPGASSGFGVFFPENGEYSPGYYVWEVTTSSGDVVTQPFYFPGKRELPVPDAQLMDYEWLADGSLALSWANPIGDYDRVQIGMHKEDDTDLFYCTFDSSLNVEDFVIPADVIQSMTNLLKPQTALWTMRVRVHGDDGMMYARAYSDVVEIPWITR